MILGNRWERLLIVEEIVGHKVQQTRNLVHKETSTERRKLERLPNDFEIGPQFLLEIKIWYRQDKQDNRKFYGNNQFILAFHWHKPTDAHMHIANGSPVSYA